METFSDLVQKLQEVHDREVEGWQVKVKELSNKKGCETKRMEELFTRNQQMKEQHRILTENLKTLENRLRAGLCDRCTVTQEVAKRRQQEFEASQIQSLQHISILAAEMTNLKKENIKLKDEIRNIRAALSKVPIEHSSNSNTDAKAKAPTDPSPHSGLVVPPTTSRGSNQPADGDVVVKMESEQQGEEAERRPPKATNPSAIEMLKPLASILSTPWKPEKVVSCVAEKRNVEAPDQHAPVLLQAPLKNSSSSPSREVKPNRPVIHAPIPYHPQPIKPRALTLSWPVSEPSDWTSRVLPGLNPIVQNPTRQPPPRYPVIAPISQVRRHSFGPSWPRPRAPQLLAKEPTVVFKLRSPPQYVESQAKPQKKDGLSSKPEKVSPKVVRDTCDVPLDLSDPGKPKDERPIASQQRNLNGEGSTEKPAGSSPSFVLHPSPSTTPGKQQEMDAQGTRKQEKREEGGKSDQSNGRKVPVLTLSLRPVVMLETLNSALQKQVSSSNGKVSPTSGSSPTDASHPHWQPEARSPARPFGWPLSSSPSIEAKSSSDDQFEDASGSEKDSSHSSKRKRSTLEVDTGSDSDTNNLQQERRIKITMRREGRAPS